jgi:hypothetical protein
MQHFWRSVCGLHSRLFHYLDLTLDTAVTKRLIANIPEEYKEKYRELYAKIYRESPMRFQEHPVTLQETLNHGATLRMLRTLNEGQYRPVRERLRAEENIQIIHEKCLKLGLREEAIAKDEDIGRRLQWVREDVDLVVRSDRLSTFKAGRQMRSSCECSVRSFLCLLTRLQQQRTERHLEDLMDLMQ